MISDCTFDAGTSWTSIGHYLNMYTNILYFKELGWATIDGTLVDSIKKI